jgi:hypothetical protein
MNLDNRYGVLLLVLTIMACNKPSTSESTMIVQNMDSTIAEASKDSSQMEIDDTGTDRFEDNFMQTMYIVIADTGYDYHAVRRQMIDLNRSTSIPIDTMDRYYNENHRMIMVPDSLEDELYGKYYFMRRYPSESMSIEYLNYYDSTIKDDRFAIFAGMYESEAKADSLLDEVLTYSKNAYMLPVEMYMGCMH